MSLLRKNRKEQKRKAAEQGFKSLQNQQSSLRKKAIGQRGGYGVFGEYIPEIKPQGEMIHKGSNKGREVVSFKNKGAQDLGRDTRPQTFYTDDNRYRSNTGSVNDRRRAREVVIMKDGLNTQGYIAKHKRGSRTKEEYSSLTKPVETKYKKLSKGRANRMAKRISRKANK